MENPILKNDEINTLQNKVFRLECEQMKWRNFRTMVESVVIMQTTFGTVNEKEMENLKKELESIRYY
jgi:hypothetical protein